MILRRLRLSSTPMTYCRMKSTNSSKNEIPTKVKEKNVFEKELKSKIKLHGPMNISQFMLEVLSNPHKGYYTTKENVLGSAGDFVTAPEISQMFGECIAAWLIHEWTKMGRVKPLNLVELGPGQGTLMQDILRTMLKLVPNELQDVSVHFVETSPVLTKIQEARLCGYFHNKPEKPEVDDGKNSSNQNVIHHAISKHGPPVRWYTRLADVPTGFSFFIANEFFDALPIHQFVKDPNSKSWEEVLVDLDNNGIIDGGGDHNLKFVKSRGRTLANQYIESDPAYQEMEMAEISPKSGTVGQKI